MLAILGRSYYSNPHKNPIKYLLSAFCTFVPCHLHNRSAFRNCFILLYLMVTYSGLNGDAWFGKRVFAHIIKCLKVRSSWVICVGPKASDKCPYKRQRREDMGGQGQEDLVKTKAEIGLIATNEEVPRANRSWKRQGRSFFYSLWMEHSPANTWLWTSGLHICERTNFCCFQPFNLW